MSRVWLVGENNPYGHEARFALYPWPQGCSGYRLCFNILRMTEEQYLASFERRNLLAQDRWSAPAARAAANDLLGEITDGDALVLCGAKVAKAFGARYEPLSDEVHAAASLKISWREVVVPHPSGLNRAWADPTLAPRVREKVLALVEASRG